MTPLLLSDIERAARGSGSAETRPPEYDLLRARARARARVLDGLGGGEETSA